MLHLSAEREYSRIMRVSKSPGPAMQGADPRAVSNYSVNGFYSTSQKDCGTDTPFRFSHDE